MRTRIVSSFLAGLVVVAVGGFAGDVFSSLFVSTGATQAHGKEAAVLLADQRSQTSQEVTTSIRSLPTADGFRGIWYANQPSGDEYRFKYSGGMATYPQQHMPIAIYAEAANKTFFFFFGGRNAEKNELLHMISYFDHETGLVARPRVLLNKKTSDAHDNPTLAIDDDGHFWIFSNAHGTGRRAYIHRSTQPYAIDEFELIRDENFSYGQPWHLPEHGFVFLHTHYDAGRRMLYQWRSSTGREWGEREPLSRIEKGQYQVSLLHEQTLATAFNMHPEPVGLNARANLYYMQTQDGGDTWTNAAGEDLNLPLTERDNAALAIDSIADEQLVYLKDIAFTSAGQPVVLYLNSSGYESGPKNDPRMLRVAHFDGDTWQVRDVTTTDHNYDYALLSIDRDADGNETWSVLGTTEPGPQPFCTGGEISLWTSRDYGTTWTKRRQLTTNSNWNHNFPRRPHNAHPDFYALWADGNALELSRSRMYFTNRDGTAVWQLPEVIEGDAMMAEPIRAATPATFAVDAVD